jgi:hypothetical protein
MFLKERETGLAHEEEDISSYWKILRKREGTGSSKRKH